MTPVTSPPLATATSAAAPQLQLGQVVRGLVVAMIDATTLRLQLPAGTFDVKTNAPLTPGTPVKIAVQGTPAQPELIVTPARSDVANLSEIPSEPDGGEPVPANATAAGTAQSAEPLRAAANTSAGAPLGEAALTSATAIVRDAAARQGGLATLYADVEAVVADPTPSAPAPVLAAAKQLLALRLDLESGNTVDASDIKSALARSGLVAGSIAAGGLPQETDFATLGTALITLRQALKNWLDLEPDLKTASDSAPQNAATMPAAPRGATPMPPYRGAPTVPQAPSIASLQSGAPPREQAVHLLGQTDAAIARQTLLRIASLPDGQTHGANHDETTATRLMFDIPVATAQGTGVAQMSIERDGKGRGQQDTGAVWRATFSIDFEPIGPVHIKIALAGERATVTLNAERSDGAQLLSAGLPLLEAGLRGAAIEPGELRCNAGSPRPQAASPGMFLDQAI